MLKFLIGHLAVLTFVGSAYAMPEGWSGRWVGPEHKGGRVTQRPADGSLRLQASSGDIQGDSDSFYFAAQQISGDFTLVARLAGGLQYVDPWAKAGLMVRVNDSPDAAFAAALITAGNGLGFQHRALRGEQAKYERSGGDERRSVGQLLKLERVGQTVTASFSPDEGTTWEELGRSDIRLGDETLVGIVWATHDPANEQNVSFNQITLDGKALTPTQSEEAESRLRSKDNPLYPPLHTSGELAARRAYDFVDSIAFATHLTAGGANGFTKIHRPALRDINAGTIRDGGRETRFLEAVKTLGEDGIRYVANMVPDGERTVKEQIEREILPVIDSIVAIEGPNEPDIMPWFANYKGMVWPESIRAYQDDLYDAVKNHSDERVRNLIVLSPPIAHPHENARILGPVACDMVSLHVYAGGALPDDQWASKWYVGARYTSPDKPIYITETGYHYQDKASGQPGISERAGARYVPRLFLDMFNLGVVRTHYYNLSNDAWGDLRADGSLRPSMIATKNLIAIVTDDDDEASSFDTLALDVAISGETKDLRHLLLQKADRTFYLILWNNIYSYDYEKRVDIATSDVPVTLTFDTSASVKLYRPLATVLPFDMHEAVRELQVEVPDHPLILQIRSVSR